jgi:hypothetical protein
MGAKKLDRTKLAKNELVKRLHSISAAALEAVNAVESDDDDWAEAASEHMETIDSDLDVAWNKIEPFLEEPPEAGDEGEGGEEHPNAED